MFGLRQALPFALLIALALMPGAARSQPPVIDDICPVIVDKALDAVGTHCTGLERNRACYAYVRVDATFAVAVDDDVFSEPADITDIALLRSLQTTALTPEDDLWGVAVLNVQANVPLTLPGQAVMFLLLGNAQVENRVDVAQAFVPRNPVLVAVESDQRVNLRSGPGLVHNVVMSVDSGTWLAADGLSADGEWLRVFHQNAPAWIYRPLVRSPLAWLLTGLPTIDDDLRTPMQAFYFTTGLGVPVCNEAPDAVVVQGPQNVTVSLSVNGADITIGSTVVLLGDFVRGMNPDTGQPYAEGCRLTQMIVLDGSADLDTGQFSLPTGYMAETIACPDADGELVQQGEWGNISPAPPELLQRFETLERLPDGVLRYPVRVPDPQQVEPLPPPAPPTPTPPPRPTS